jgi:hypothetical protein
MKETGKPNESERTQKLVPQKKQEATAAYGQEEQRDKADSVPLLACKLMEDLMHLLPALLPMLTIVVLSVFLVYSGCQ